MDFYWKRFVSRYTSAGHNSFALEGLIFGAISLLLSKYTNGIKSDALLLCAAVNCVYGGAHSIASHIC